MLRIELAFESLQCFALHAKFLIERLLQILSDNIPIAIYHILCLRLDVLEPVLASIQVLTK